MQSSKPRVLLVEDDESTRFLLRELLEPSFDVFVFVNATEALAGTAGEQFDACITDISLRDEYDGVQLMNELRDRPELSEMPIVAITAYYWRDEAELLLREGFDAFFEKPFDADELTAAVHQLIAA